MAMVTEVVKVSTKICKVIVKCKGLLFPPMDLPKFLSLMEGDLCLRGG